MMPGCPGRTAQEKEGSSLWHPARGWLCKESKPKTQPSYSFSYLHFCPQGPGNPLASPALHTCPRALLNPVGADPLPTPACWTGRLDSWALRSFLPPSCVTLAKLLTLFEA